MTKFNITKLMEAKFWLPSIFIVGLVLRFYNLGKELWSDEVITYGRSFELFSSTNPSSSISPLYFILSRLALEISNSDYIIRIPSAIAGSFVPIVTYLLVLKFFKSYTAACLASLWIALSTYSVFLSQDARYYALLTLLFLIALYYLYNWFETKSNYSLVLYAVISGLALSCHLSYAPIIISLNSGILLALFIDKPSYKLFAKYSFIFLSSSLITLLTFAFIVSNFGNISVLKLSLRLLNFIPSQSDSTEGIENGIIQESILDESGLPEFHGGSGNVYFLEYPQYLQYMQLYFQELNLYYIIPFLLIGFLVALRLKPYAAITLLLCMIIAPCMGFFIPVNHWYSPRYLVLQLPIITIMATFGVVSILKFLLTKIGCENNKNETLSFGIAIVVSSILIYVYFIPGLRSHYNHIQRQNFRVMAENIVPHLKTGDTIIHLWKPSRTTREWNYLSQKPLDFYIQHISKDARGLLSGISQMGLSTEEEVANIAPNFTESNIWIIDSVHRSRTNRDAHQYTEDWKFVTEAGRDTMVWVIPNAFNNLVADIGNYDSIEDLLSENHVEKFGSLPLQFSHDKHNHAQIIMHSPEIETNSTGIRFFVQPDNITIENSDFKVNEVNEIAGWSVNGEIDYVNNGGIKLADAEGKVTRISQTIDLQNLKQENIRFDINAVSNHAVIHAGFLCFGNDGIKVFSVKREHQTGEFQETFYVPTEQFDIQSGIVFIEVEAGEVIVKKITSDRINPKNLLSNDSYILSVVLKSENIVQGDNPARVARINLTIYDEYGENLFFERLRLDGTSEYNNYRFFINPGRNRVAKNITRMHIDIGIYRGMGTLKLNSIQFEKGINPTYTGQKFFEPR